MGDVYLAEDSRLGRKVALKVLSSASLNDSQFRARFLREARSVSRLSHPHICVLHDIGNQDGIDFLVMEYVEGETLADRLRRGPIPLDQALRYAIEIADALDTAHRQGITHRDLKPANLMLTKSGTKLLDFGLAKIESKTSVENAVAQTSDLTTGGMILGTLPYMAPEQLEGKETDARTDIFAFGAVLYETITGQKAFQGESQASLVAAILEHDPPQMISRERMTPPSVERLVKVCLAKNPDDRWQSARDLCRELQWIADSVAAGDSASPATPIPGSRGGRRTWFLAGGFAVILLLALLPALLYFLRVPPQAPAIRFEMSAPGIIGAPVISPDGQQIAYVANTDGKNAIWVRPIGAVAARPLSGTENAAGSMFWSPDNRYLGFFADGKLKKIDLSNGFVTELSNWFRNGGTWNRNGDILITSETSKSGGIFRVSDAGGTLTQITEADRSGKQWSVHQYPQFLPDGRHFLYHAAGPTGSEAIVYLGSLDSKSTTRLATLPNFSSIADEGMKYGAGYLLFRRDNTLMAQAFDVKRLALEGDPMPLVENINGGFSVSENGVLVYQRASDSVQQSATQLLWFDRRGKPGGQVTAPANIDTIQLSPEGRRVAVTTNARFTDLSDVWVIDLSDGVPNKLNAENPYWDGYAIWSPDGSRIIFSSGRAGHPPISMYQQFSNGNGKAELLLQNGSNEQDTPQDWHGDYILFRRTNLAALHESNLWVLPMSGDRRPKPYLPQSRFAPRQAQVSPNGRYLAYVTDESGTNQVVVQTFPDPTKGKWPITSSGGIEPRWRGDGRELFYLEPDGKLTAVSVKTESTFEVGDREVLFQIPFATGLPLWVQRYDVTADGQRFLVVPPPTGSGETSPATITAVVNWPALLRRK